MKAKRPRYSGSGSIGWGGLKKKSLPTIEHQDRRADRLYRERLIEEGETPEWADHLVLRYRMSRVSRRLKAA